MNRHKKLPVGKQTFQDFPEQGYLYVDKTRLIHRLIMDKTACFLSRPRRFGKSLLISTMEAIFQGRKELFHGLWIEESSDYDWPEYPIIRLDMSKLEFYTLEQLRSGLIKRLRESANLYGIEIEENELPGEYLNQLISCLSAKRRVVVLVDEYDKPILNNIEDAEKAGKIRDILRDFYGILKAQDANLRFVFLTGVSRFSKVSVFSGINHLSDISMVRDYGSLLGYTQNELEKFFQEWIQYTSDELNMDIGTFLDKARLWYNGYRFHPNSETVYNPFSCLKLFENQEFSNWWFETGTPSFLIKLIKEKQLEPPGLEFRQVGSRAFSLFDVENPDVISLLLQTGYLTIRDYKEELYTLDYPNLEVRKSFLTSLAETFTHKAGGDLEACIIRMKNALKKSDANEFFAILTALIAGIPYQLHLSDERYYHSLFYLIFRLMGITIRAEESSSHGRLDAVIELENGIWIFEFKYKGSAQAAISQIREKGYAIPYKTESRPVYLVGVNFDPETRNVREWVVEGV